MIPKEEIGNSHTCDPKILLGLQYDHHFPQLATTWCFWSIRISVIQRFDCILWSVWSFQYTIGTILAKLANMLGRPNIWKPLAVETIKYYLRCLKHDCPANSAGSATLGIRFFWRHDRLHTIPTKYPHRWRYETLNFIKMTATWS